MSALSFENKTVDVEIIPYKQDFDGIHILCGEELSFFKKYLNVISLPIENDELLQKYFDAWCIKVGHLSKLKKCCNLENSNFAEIKNMFCCEAHNDILRTEATVYFEGKADTVTDLISDIELLQEMEIPN